MRTFYFSLIGIFVCCCTFMSCERIPQMTETLVPGEEIVDSDVDNEEDVNMEDGMSMEENTITDIDMGMQVPDDMSIQGITVVINELMADNDNTIADPQGDFDDWLELYNPSDSPASLTGMYLSDKEDEHTKWQFPDNTEIAANGYLIVWLDEDGEDMPDGLHANFKLSKNGEIVLFVDNDTSGNQVLDSVTFGEQDTDIAIGRLPNGTGDFQIVKPTPGAENTAE